MGFLFFNWHNVSVLANDSQLYFTLV